MREGRKRRQESLNNPVQHFDEFKDLRVKKNRYHLLEKMKNSFRLPATEMSWAQPWERSATTSPACGRTNAAIRQHWGIEIKSRRALDISLGDDRIRKRAGNCDRSFPLLNHSALNLLRQETGTKRCISRKRLEAGRDHGYLVKLLGI
jgi:hypothetical protein